jgi:hypothetical protein
MGAAAGAGPGKRQRSACTTHESEDREHCRNARFHERQPPRSWLRLRHQSLLEPIELKRICVRSSGTQMPGDLLQIVRKLVAISIAHRFLIRTNV